MFSDCSIRAPLRSKCLLMALHQDTLLSFAETTKSRGMLHMLPDTETPGASTEDLPSVQVKACCVRLKKKPPSYRSDALQISCRRNPMYLPDHFRHAFPQDPIRHDMQRWHIFSHYSYITTPNNTCKPVSQLRYSLLFSKPVLLHNTATSAVLQLYIALATQA